MRLSTEKVTFSVVGLGGRANAYLNALQEFYPNQFEIVAIAEPIAEKRVYAKEKFAIADELLFENDLEFMKQKRLSDVAIIATQDSFHFKEAVSLLEKGYDLILEKPISTNLEEIIELYKISKNYPNQIVAVCHVLRHSVFFNTIKQIVDSKKFGEVISIQHNENVGYYHFAHSYVRGQWNNSNTSGPVIMTKSCHDMDILLYLLGDKHAKTIASIGSLSMFCEKKFNAKIMADNCANCSIQNSCAYSAVKIYGSHKIKSVVFDLTTVEDINKNLLGNQYGRCVYKCDNNVADHQATIIEFSDGITATFNLSAFTAKVNRSIKIMCEFGEIRAIEKPYTIETTDFRTDETKSEELNIVEGGHGGADKNFIINFMRSYMSNRQFESTLEKSIESHIMSLYAEKSRVCGGEKQDIEEIMKNIR